MTNALKFNTPIDPAVIEAQKKIQALVNDMYAAKLESDEAEKKFKALKSEVSSLMESTGTDKISAEKCNVTGNIKSNVSVPKDEKAKAELFEYIKDNYGVGVLQSMLTINARSFTSWYTAEIDKHVKEGNHDFKLEMLSPYEVFSLGIRKKAAKK